MCLPRSTGGSRRNIAKLACSSPARRDRCRLGRAALGGAVVELAVVDSLSTETVRRTPEKNDPSQWMKSMWCIPPRTGRGLYSALA